MIKNDLIHRDVFILERRLERCLSDCEHILKAIRSCHGAMNMLKSDNTTKDGMASAPLPSGADPFGPNLAEDYD